MCSNNPKILFLLLLALISSSASFAQSTPAEDSAAKRNKSLVLFIGGGASYYANSVNPPAADQSSITRLYPATTIRVMWYPQYRLRLGLQSGTTTFYSYEVTEGSSTGKVKLTAIPVMIMWSMPIVERLNVYAGFGTYILTSHLDFKGQVASTSMSLGSNIALAYEQPLSKSLGLAFEGKWENDFVSKNNAVSLQIHLAWKFLEWRSK